MIFADEKRACLQALKKYQEARKTMRDPGKVIIHEFVDGEEFVVEASIDPPTGMTVVTPLCSPPRDIKFTLLEMAKIMAKPPPMV